jgi:hypothetical protein
MENINSLIDELAGNEDKLMLLYWAYAKRFPEQWAVWNKLAEEEKNHAMMLRGCLNLLIIKI